MDDTSKVMETKSAATIAAEQHAAQLRANVEAVIDVAQEYATSACDYATSFLSTLFGGSK